MIRRPSAWVAILLGIFGGLGGLGGPARALAEDPPASPPPQDGAPDAAVPKPDRHAPGGPLFLQWFDVGALTSGLTLFRQERGPMPTSSDMVNDESNPLFGGEGEERGRSVGLVENLIELLKSTLPPATFEADGVAISPLGPDRLLVTATAPTLTAIARTLAELEEQALATVTLDVVLLRGDVAEAGLDGGLAGAVRRGALVAVSAARTSGFAGQSVVGRHGGMFAYVQEEDVEVAQDAKGSDPIVGTAFDGLSFRADLVTSDAARVRARVQAWYAAPGSLQTIPTVESGLVEALAVDGLSVSREVNLAPGTWMLLSADANHAFAVRAGRRAAGSKPAPHAGLPLPAPGASTSPLTLRRFDLSDLLAPVQNARGPLVRIDPSNFSPPQPPELPEPMPAFMAETLVEVARHLVGHEATRREGVSLDLRMRTLFARTPEDAVPRLERFLGMARTRTLRAMDLRATIVALPLASFPEYVADLDDGATLLADGGEALLRRSGARVLDRLHVHLRDGQRGVAVAGRQRSYLGDYDVEVAEKSSIGNPIMHRVFEGSVLDVRGNLVTGGDALSCEVRFDRTTPRPVRAISTPYGPLECPSLTVLRVRGSAVVPLGATRLLGVALDGGEVTLVLLSAANE